MTERERKFKIEKRTSYEEELKTSSKHANMSAFLLGFCGLAIITTASKFTENPDLSENLSNFLKLAASTGVTAMDMSMLIESVMNKIILKQKITDISDELELDDQIKEDEKFDQIIHGGR